MSESDIYKKREPIPMGKKPEKKRRRRRSDSHRSFDDHTRKRRSKNSGLRRLLHLSRKAENEKVIWTAFGVGLLIVVVAIAIWQFFIQERLVRQEENNKDYAEYLPVISTASSEPLMGEHTASGSAGDSASE
ncbi:hypothetical protein [Pontiella agarivorans]|uniref:Uncharacterized protein n=1 Tax=Pontiella agarivorans TaxID=3038953 RepID=A0ABU5MT98_9BACT|nr:hypothetical protein [Pontiella agarivorans]MDZ8117440.1 hypothetical protein [Pontiella agarivorans]